MDETYGTYVDDECFDNHDYNDDTDHDTDDDTDDEIDDDPNYDTDEGGRGTGISYKFRREWFRNWYIIQVPQRVVRNLYIIQVPRRRYLWVPCPGLNGHPMAAGEMLYRRN